MKKFEISDEQQAKIRAWVETLDLQHFTTGEALDYVFTPSGIGTHVVVRAATKDGVKELNVTDYDNW